MNTIDEGNLAVEVDENAAREPLPPGTIVGPHRILSLIASGGMGDVYRARDERLGRDVALKVLPQGITSDRERIERFAQEAKAASALNHPNIVAIYEIGKGRPSPVVQPIDAKSQRQHTEIHYIAMELVEGLTLREFFPTHPSLIRMLELLAQMAEGLGKAHGAGIVHRDLKPENIMVSAEGYAKVVDFGLAKLVEPSRGWNPLGADSPTMRAITQQGEVIGTAGYMSPEQIVGKTVDQRSDIFSFGCIVYESVTGRRPFEGDSFVDTMHQVLHATPAPIEDRELQRIVSKCLVKDREYRYQSIRDVALDLRAHARELEHGAPASAGDAKAAATKAPAKAGAPLAIGIAALIVATIIGWRLMPRAAAPASAIAAAPRTTMQRITSNGHVGHVATSGDGKFVAYTTSDEKGHSVWLEQTATGSSVMVIPQSPTAYYAGLAFSADSNYLFTTAYDGTMYGTLNAVPLLGGAPAKLSSDADTAASGSPDGTQIVYTRDVLEKGESRVLVASRDGSNERVVAAFALPRRAVSPSWSPDGKHIAVAHGTDLSLIDPLKASKTSVNGWRGAIKDLSWRDNDTLLISGSDDRTAGHLQLFSISVADGRVRDITSDSDDYFEPHVAGSSIAAIQAKRQSTLWSVDMTTPATELTRGIGRSDGLNGATWTPDKHIVYTSSAGGPVDLWIANSDGTSPRQLTHDDAVEFDPSVTPDGAAVLYLTRSRTQWTLWRVNVDGTQQRQIATSPVITDFTVTPDSKRVVYASCDDKTGCALMTTSLDGGTPSTITPTGVFLRYLHVTPDGSRVVFSALDEKKVKLFSAPIAGGKPTRLLPDRATEASVSPDGLHVACSYDMGEKGAKLGIFDLDHPTEPHLFDLEGSSYRWMPDGKSIVFFKYTGEASNIFLFRDNHTTPVTQFKDGSIANADVTKDGRILFTRVVEARDVVLLAQ